MKEYAKARSAFEAALALDSTNVEAREGLTNAIRNDDEPIEQARKRALQDPEVQEILRSFLFFSINVVTLFVFYFQDDFVLCLVRR